MSFIETERLLLRTWILPADAAEAQTLFGSADAQRLYIRGSLPPEGVESYVSQLAAHEERDGFGVWPVVEKSSRRLIGACGLSRVADLNGEVEIEWIVTEAARGKGYATEAARAVLMYAFSQAKLSRVCALVDPENAASVAIVNTLAMRFDRVVRAYKRDLLQYVATAPP